jgi:acyl-CoA synthetase (AMP-forming)/AMP-acid ligase II
VIEAAEFASTNVGEADFLPQRLARTARLHPSEAAYRFVKRGRAVTQITWAGLWADARETAERLRSLAVAGAPVAIACEDPADFVVALAACLISGSAAVPLPVSLSRRSAPRAAAILNAAAPAAVLTGAATGDWLAQLLSTRTVAHVARGVPAGPVTGPAHVEADTLALIQFTSGSTGDPRGIALTHGNVAANCAGIAEAYGLGPATRGLSWLPLHHDMGLIGHVVTPMWLGCRSTIVDPLTFLQRPLSWLRLASEERATITSAPNFAYETVARAAEAEDLAGIDLSSLTAAVCGGEPVLAETVERFLATLAPAGFRPAAFAPSYGLAEATLLVSSGRRPDGPRFVGPSSSAHHAGGAGRIVDLGPPIDGVTVRIVDDEGNAVADGAIGEIEIAGDSVGRPVGEPGAAGAGPLKTGDLGCLKGGHLLVVGRKKDLIILRGQNIYPSDVEAAATEAHRAVAPGGVAAVGILADGTEQLIVMVEIDRAAQLPGSQWAALTRTVSENVGRRVGHVPAEVVILKFGTLPRTSSGKVRRRAAAELYAGGKLQPAATTEREVRVG